MRAEESERVLAAVMFTDLVDSTRTRERLTSEHGLAAANEYFDVNERLVKSAVSSQDGTSPQWAGDGVLAVFPSAAGALEAACDIQHRVVAHNDNPLRQADMAVRIGIAVGDVGLRSDGASGTATVQAKRLCDDATGAQILCTNLVRVLAAGSEGFKFAEADQRFLKGYEAPVDVVELNWQSHQLSPADTFPDRLLDRSGLSFAGRERELDHLRESWRKAGKVGPQLVLLSGEPGVGKTRTAGESARQAHSVGSEVLYGRCGSKTTRAYQPFAEALRDRLRLDGHLTGDPLVDAELGRLLPAADRVHAGLPEPEPMASMGGTAQLYDAAATWLHQISADRAAIMVLDDLIWADDGTLDLLVHLIENEPDLAVQFIGTHRDQGIEDSDAWSHTLGLLARTEALVELPLRGLRTDEVVQLLRGAQDFELQHADESFARRLTDLTAGNPFLIADTLRWLQQEGRLSDAVNGTWPDLSGHGTSLPDKAAKTAEQRLLLIAEDHRDHIRVAALVGHHFDVDVLADVVDVDILTNTAAIEQAEAAGIIRPQPSDGPLGYVFNHDLLREALVRGISPSRLPGLHRRIGYAMAASWATRNAADASHAAEIGRHLALSHDPEAQRDAVEQMQLGAERALQQAAPATALDLVRQAITLAERIGIEENKLAELQFHLGIAMKRTGTGESRQTLLEAGRRATDAGNNAVAIQAAIANSRGLFSSVGRVDRKRVAQLEAAIALVGTDASIERASLMASLSQELIYDGDRERAEELSSEALTLARETGNSKAIVRALNARHSVVWHPGGLTERIAIVAEWESLADELGNIGWASSAASFGYATAIEVGSFDTAQRRLNALADNARVLHQPQLSAYLQLWTTTQATLDGDLDEAERLISEAHTLNQATGNPDGETWRMAQLYPVRWHQGRLAELEPGFAFGFEALPELPVLGAALANIYAETGDLNRCRAVLDRFPIDDVLAGWVDVDQSVTLACLTRVAHILDDAAQARPLVDLLAPYQNHHISNGSVHFGSTQHYLGLAHAVLGNRAESDQAFAVAEQMNHAMKSPPLVARTQQAWAAMLAEGDGSDQDRARRLAGEAIEVTKRLDLDGIRQDAEATVAKLS